MIIAIDGPAGSGKSTIAKLLADKLNYTYLDTGAMYRLFTYYILKQGIEVTDFIKIKEEIQKFHFQLEDGKFYLNDQLIDLEIRQPEITNNVSHLAKLKEVRDFFVNWQREYAKNKNCILDGRDIGTVVFPNADHKFYLTASAEVRARRRQEQFATNETFEEIVKALLQRDEIDQTRKEGPLKKAEDAIEICTDVLTIEAIITKICREIGK